MVKGISLFGLKRHPNSSDCFNETYSVTHDDSRKRSVSIVLRAAHDLLWLRRHMTFIPVLPQAETSGSCSDTKTHNTVG